MGEDLVFGFFGVFDYLGVEGFGESGVFFGFFGKV